MDEAAARRALREVGVEAGAVRPVGDGWANWTFLVDDRLIVRFPRNDEIAEATGRELRLLPTVAAHVSFEVPDPTVVGEWDGRPFFGYQMIEGRPLAESQHHHVEAVGQMLGELHDVPVDEAAALLGTPDPQDAWREYYEGFWPRIVEVALPELDSETADVVRERYTRMIEHPPEFPVCLIHNDLGPVHVLVAPERPVGIIDFESAWIGDPAVDIAPLAAYLGMSVLPQLTGGRELGGALEDRLAFYRWMGSIHAIIYGVEEDDRRERNAGVSELQRRLKPGRPSTSRDRTVDECQCRSMSRTRAGTVSHSA